MSPAGLDLLLNGAFVYVRPDGSRYATWSNMARYGVNPVARTGPLSTDDLERPSSEVLATINLALSQEQSA